MLANAKRIVIKIGSSLIVDEASRHVREAWLATLAEDVSGLRAQGKEVIMVTSGAIPLGRNALGYGTRALELEEKQAAAACGQIELFAAWRDAFAAQEIKIAQLLLTADDSIVRRRYLNARNTIETLLQASALPVINENDTVATAEIRFGDNDRLAARVAQMAGADLLILFSDIDGLYTANPASNPDARLVPEVKEITADIEKMAGGAASAVSSGGMITKIEAARIAMNAGCHMMIARGTVSNPLQALAKGSTCTRFIAHGNPMSARKHWIAGSLHPAGSVTVDDGAVVALKGGKSLLPAGVVAVDGEFERGDAVLIRNMNGVTIGRGLMAYGSQDALRIMGHKSQDIEQILGFKGRQSLIHRDDMTLE